MELGWQLALAALLVILLFAVIIRSSKNETKAKQANYAVNNTLADLIENKVLVAVATSNPDSAYPHVRLGTEKPQNSFAEKILSLGFAEDTELSTKDFHENLYNAHDELIDEVESAMPFHHLDITTTPETRMENGNEAVKDLLPYLILGDLQGTDSRAENTNYINDESYMGYMNTNAAFLMTSM